VVHSQHTLARAFAPYRVQKLDSLSIRDVLHGGRRRRAEDVKDEGELVDEVLAGKEGLAAEQLRQNATR